MLLSRRKKYHNEIHIHTYKLNINVTMNKITQKLRTTRKSALDTTSKNPINRETITVTNRLKREHATNFLRLSRVSTPVTIYHLRMSQPPHIYILQ